MIQLDTIDDAVTLFRRWLEVSAPPTDGAPYRARFGFEIVVDEKGVARLVVDQSERVELPGVRLRRPPKEEAAA